MNWCCRMQLRDFPHLDEFCYICDYRFKEEEE